MAEDASSRPFCAALHRVAERVWGTLRAAWQLMVATARRFLDARAFDHAASLSFFALLSLAPMVVLLVSAAGYLAHFLGPDSVQIDAVVGRLTQWAQRFSPVEGERVESVVQALIARRGQIGLWGTGVLILGASMVFGALEHAMKDIFIVERSRRYLVSRVIFSVVLIAVVVVMFVLQHALMAADSLLVAWEGRTLDEVLRDSAVLDALLAWLPVPLAFLAVLHAPGLVRPRFLHAVAGALLFLVLWELARGAYAFYVTRIAAFGVLYGSLAAPLLLILWTFYAMNILLLAMCFTAVLPSLHGPRE